MESVLFEALKGFVEQFASLSVAIFFLILFFWSRSEEAKKESAKQFQEFRRDVTKELFKMNATIQNSDANMHKELKEVHKELSTTQRELSSVNAELKLFLKMHKGAQ